ncbi:MAG TPA: glycosyltransferase family 39 protein [Candidatus Acidoferrales bacterium]|nr:glycosyltransferase family 39 protein [Candidatus Acidoferrales bacterium]
MDSAPYNSQVVHTQWTIHEQPPHAIRGWRVNSGDYLALAVVTIAVMLVHIATNGRFGFHRDELQVLDDARHLTWGFVAYPPFTPLIERTSLALFGTSLVGLRLFSVLTQGAVIFFTGLIARELAARRLAQIVAALAVAVSPIAMFQATEFQYSSFDLLWWVLIAYFLIRLIKYENPRWWIGIGIVVGVGMETKYTMAFCVAGILGALLLTSERRYLKTRWLWYGVAISILIFLPNLIWQIQHGMVSLHFLQHIHKRDVGEGRANGYWRDQFMINTNPVLAPLWLAGLYYFFADREGKRYRMLAWLWAIPVVILFVMKGRGYYAGAVYPMLFAAGCVLWGHLLSWLRVGWRWAVRIVTFAAIALGAYGAGRLILPLGPVSANNFALKNNGDLREEIGWTDLVAEVARIRDSLSPAERSHLAVITANYGETGAIDLYGPAYGLPQAISGTNTAWYRGYGDPPPQTLIVLGLSQRYVNEKFQGCRVAGHDGNPYGIHNEESVDHPDIFVCGPPRQPWPQFWIDFRSFG